MSRSRKESLKIQNGHQDQIIENVAHPYNIIRVTAHNLNGVEKNQYM